MSATLLRSFFCTQIFLRSKLIHPCTHLIHRCISSFFFFGSTHLKFCVEYKILCNRPKQSTKIMKIMSQRKWQTSHSACECVFVCKNYHCLFEISTVFSIVFFLSSNKKTVFFLFKKKRKTKMICVFFAIVFSLCSLLCFGTKISPHTHPKQINFV